MCTSGFPLVHNSHLLADCGHRYHDLDCEEGGQQLRRAFAEHDADRANYRGRASAFLARLDPEYEDNVRIYTEAIDALMARA
ncbi:MAG TPA: DUF2827 family protein [Variovorax sp.]|nr:DUF2827 family protein [Variovorax sp.]